MVSDDNYTPVLLIYYISFVQMLSAVVCVGQNSKIFLNSKNNLLKSLKVYLNMKTKCQGFFKHISDFYAYHWLMGT